MNGRQGLHVSIQQALSHGWNADPDIHVHPPLGRRDQTVHLQFHRPRSSLACWNGKRMLPSRMPCRSFMPTRTTTASTGLVANSGSQGTRPVIHLRPRQARRFIEPVEDFNIAGQSERHARHASTQPTRQTITDNHDTQDSRPSSAAMLGGATVSSAVWSASEPMSGPLSEWACCACATAR